MIKKKKKPKVLIFLFILVLLLIVARILLPSIIKRYVNGHLHRLSEYTGHLHDIDIRLIRGAYIIRDLTIMRIDQTGKKSDTIPFYKSSDIDLSIDWRSIFHGKIVGKIIVKDPVLNFVNEKKKNDISGDTADFRDLIKSLMPLTINRFEIRNGQIHYIDIYAKPSIDIALSNIYITATNLTNVVDKEKILPAKVNAEASMYNGFFYLNVLLNPLKKNPTFELKTEMKGMDLPSLNDFFKAYGNIEIKKGTFSVYAEFAGKEGEFGGYVKPFIKDFKLDKWEENDKPGQRLWEMFVGTAMKILENPKTDKVATKIPVNGRFSDPEINNWKAIHYIIRNAFVQALRPTIENSISINKMNDETKKTFLEKIFNGKDKKEKSEKNGDNVKKKNKRVDDKKAGK